MLILCSSQRSSRCDSKLQCAEVNAIINLQSKGLSTLFEEIVTNPAEWDPSGLLKLRRRVDANGPQHTCKVGCSPNMCKGNPGVSDVVQYSHSFLCRRRARRLPRTT